MTSPQPGNDVTIDPERDLCAVHITGPRSAGAASTGEVSAPAPRRESTLARVNGWIATRWTPTQLAGGSAAAFSAAFVVFVVVWVVRTPLLPGQGTVLGGLGVLAAGGITYYGTHRTRVSNERIAGAAKLHAQEELAHERDKLTTTNERDDDKAERTENREQERALRARFTASAAQLADLSPTIRLAGVFSLVSLADDWCEFGNVNEQNVCIELLRSYIVSPQNAPSPDVDDAAPFLHVRAQIVRTLHDRQTRDTDTIGHWGHTEGKLLVRARLDYLNLSGVDLAGANFDHANLAGANLTGANLAGADLSFTNLTGADLSFTNLTGADLSFTNLTGANLFFSKLTYIGGYSEFDKSTRWPDGSHVPPPEVANFFGI